VTSTVLKLGRPAILAYRQRVGALDERLPYSRRSLQLAAWMGLQDSVPRAALLSIHARVRGATPSSWEDPSLVQLWGPRFSTYVIAARDRALFTLARLPDTGPALERAEDLATRLHALLEGRKMLEGEAGRALSGKPYMVRYAAPTGRVLIRWDGARTPTIWTVPAPAVAPAKARLELARRYLHILGPTTPAAFAAWAGIKPRLGVAAFDALRKSLTPVRTPVGEAWILTKDEPAFRAAPRSAAAARILPSGDAYLLAADRELLVADAKRRRALWPPATVWPGGLLVRGELVGTWRRAQEKMTISPWRPLTRAERAAVEAEAAALPLPGLRGDIAVGWEE
jgi:hypothetical protein